MFHVFCCYFSGQCQGMRLVLCLRSGGPTVATRFPATGVRKNRRPDSYVIFLCAYSMLLPAGFDQYMFGRALIKESYQRGKGKQTGILR